MNKVLQFLIDRLDTPIGDLLIIADQEGNLRATGWEEYKEEIHDLLQLQYHESALGLEPARNPNGLTNAISRYFAGELKAIDTLAVQTRGTPFQRAVWNSLRTIPCGTAISYSKLAEQIGRPSAVRAVGLANGSNPIPIVIPCHRVIGSDGSLTGYGGGLDRKRWLLEHENCAGVNSQHKFAYNSPRASASTVKNE
jgi:methylated-DNA-[protein]-cysteine S-methyltransferase